MQTCNHMVVKGGDCIECGTKVYGIDERPCGDCQHFKKHLGANKMGGCNKHSMFVTECMHVTFKVAEGTCFTPRLTEDKADE